MALSNPYFQYEIHLRLRVHYALPCSFTKSSRSTSFQSSQPSLWAVYVGQTFLGAHPGTAVVGHRCERRSPPIKWQRINRSKLVKIGAKKKTCPFITEIETKTDPAFLRAPGWLVSNHCLKEQGMIKCWFQQVSARKHDKSHHFPGQST